LNEKREMALDEGLMLAFFYRPKFKMVLKGTVYFSENREKYWSVLDFNSDFSSYELRLCNLKANEVEAFVPFCHKRFY
jgi:hypothetical protein